MDKIKRFIDCYIPTETCNLRCHYCYIAQQRRFNKKIAKFSKSPIYIRKALSKERLGGPCLINMCAGGETMLSSEVLPIVKELLNEGHYVMIVTNGTISKRFKEIALWNNKDIFSHLFIKFSFHFLEMKRLNMLDIFFDNVNMMKTIGISFTVEVTPTDELIPYIEEIKQLCIKKIGAYPHITIARDDRTKGIDILSEYEFEDYKRIWNQFDSSLFRFKSEIFHMRRNEFCYAGDWSAYLNLETGSLRQCYCGVTLGNIYECVDRPIKFKAIGKQCTLAHCYNGHAYLALGNIPQLNCPTFAEERNRVCTDGSEWLQPKMKSFMSTKLYDSNKEYGYIKKHINELNGVQNICHYLSVRMVHKKLSWIKSKILGSI